MREDAPLKNRDPLEWLTSPGRDASYFYARWLYLRLIGFGLLASFISLASQIDGLVGPRGILPAQEYLEMLRDGGGGWLVRLLAVPSLLWIDSGRIGLVAIVLGGLISGAGLMLNLWPRSMLLISWTCY